MKPYITIVLLVVGVLGCSKEAKQTPPDFNVDATEVAGDWMLNMAAPAVQEVFTPDRFGTARLHFATNGEAAYSFIPFEEVLGSVPVPKSKWTVASGNGNWELRTWQEDGHGVWRVNLMTQTGAVPLRAERDPSGGVVLAYYPSSGTNAALVFKRMK